MSKNDREESLVIPTRIEENSSPDGEYRCIVCGMRYDDRDFAEMCCKKIAGIENLGGRRQHRWR